MKLRGAEQPRLSVIIPSHNYGWSIAEAIESVLEQSDASVEIIVVDDGSTDDTEAVLRDAIESGAIRYFRQERAGPATARNLAMAEARGSYFMFLDADDLLLPGCIERTLRFLEGNPDVGFFFTNYDIFDERGVLNASGVDIWKAFRQIPHEVIGPNEWRFTEPLAAHIILHGGFMHTSGLTVSRAIADRVGGYRPGFFYAEDDEFSARVAHETVAGYVDEVLSRKRNHSKSIINDPNNRLRNAEDLMRIRALQLDEFSDDAHIRRILRRKLSEATSGLCWFLIESGETRRARSLLLDALRRGPQQLSLWKLLAKSLVY